MRRFPLLCLATLVLAGCGGGTSPAAPTEIVVEAPGPGVLQDAVDRVASCGTVRLGPGTYHEPVDITGKIVHLVGAGADGTDPTVLEDVGAPTAQVAAGEILLHYGPGGGGSVLGIAFHGGRAAIVGSRGAEGFAEQLTLESVAIEGSGHGVVGGFLGLRIEDSSMTDVAGDGVAVEVGSGDLAMFHDLISNPAGIGILVYNLTRGPGNVVIADTTTVSCPDGGIVVVGGGRPVQITGCNVANCLIAGVLLIGGDQVTVEDTLIQYVYTGSTPGYGSLAEGLIATNCAYVDVEGCTVRDCWGSGLVFDTSGGRIRNTIVGGGSSPSTRVGLVIQGSPVAPDYDDPSNEYHGWVAEVLTDGALDVPEPPPLPDP